MLLSFAQRLEPAMAVVETHPVTISGPWVEGFVLDQHSTSSVFLGNDEWGHPRFDTTRSALGELVFHFKNKGGPAVDIIETAATFVSKQWNTQVDCVIYPPPSAHRSRQPAQVLAAGVAAILGVPALEGVVVKAIPTAQMKNVSTHERAAMLKAAIQAGQPDAVQGKRVLIVDDLWQTGSTMKRVAEIVASMGATEIRALAMTRTK